jgi:hypothetical protein
LLLAREPLRQDREYLRQIFGRDGRQQIVALLQGTLQLEGLARVLVGDLISGEQHLGGITRDELDPLLSENGLRADVGKAVGGDVARESHMDDRVAVVPQLDVGDASHQDPSDLDVAADRQLLSDPGAREDGVHRDASLETSCQEPQRHDYCGGKKRKSNQAE